MNKDDAIKDLINAAETAVAYLEEENTRYGDHPANAHRVKRNDDEIFKIKLAVNFITA